MPIRCKPFDNRIGDNAAPTITDPKAVEALNMAKVWVETRLAKGTRLNEINEEVQPNLDETDEVIYGDKE